MQGQQMQGQQMPPPGMPPQGKYYYNTSPLIIIQFIMQ
jgi:hypothetical protein